MVGILGLEVVKVIVEEMFEVYVLMLIVLEDVQDLMDVLWVGVSGYLLKNIEIDILVDVICCVVQGDLVVLQQMIVKLIQGVCVLFRVEFVMFECDCFLLCECDIMVSLVQGESNKEIVCKFDFVESIVKIYVQNIFKKLNMSSCVQVVLYVVEYGFGWSV